MKKFAVRSFLFLLIFYALNCVIGAALAIPKQRLMGNGRFSPQQRWTDFYAQPPDSIDLIFLGSSHAYRHFDPAIFDRELKLNSFNLGSPMQNPVTSFYVFKEVLLTQHPKIVVFEVFLNTFDLDDQFAYAMYNFEFMKSKKNKIDFLWNGYRKQDLIYFLLPSYSYRNNFFDLMRLILRQEIPDEDYGDVYKSKGYVENKQIAKEKELIKNNIFRLHPFSINKVNSNNIRHLNQFVEMCRLKGIKMILVTSPLPDTSLSFIDDYPSMHRYVQNLASRYNLEYIDYVQMQIDDEADIFQEKDFLDSHHLNNAGVQKFDLDFAKRMKPSLIDR